MEQPEQLHISILDKLSDIKNGLGINTNETKNVRDKVEEIKIDVKSVNAKVEFQNGRVRILEDWSRDAQKIIENTNDLASTTAQKYATDKVRVWTAIGLLIFFGGTIITLSIMAINTKIKDGIISALEEYNIEVKNNE